MTDSHRLHIPDPRNLTLGARARFIAEAFAPHLEPGMRTLDIGCGNAVVSHFLSGHFGLDLHGCDIADYRKKDMPFTLLNADEQLPFENGEFDIAMLNDVLHHTVDQRRLLREAARVARTVLAFELEPTSLAGLIDRGANFFHHRTMPMPLAFHSCEEWREILAEEGVSAQVTSIGRPRTWYPLRHILIVASDD